MPFRRLRIAYVSSPEAPNGWYRGMGPMIALAQRGHEVRQVWWPGERFREDLVTGCDVLHIHRRHDDRLWRLVRSAKEAGMGVVWDNDDDMTSVPRNNAAYKAYGGARGARVVSEVRRIVRAADLVTTPSRRLADIYTASGAERVEVVENFVRDESIDVCSAGNGDRVVVGWIAGREHHVDVEQLPIRAVLERLLAEHRNVEVVSIGVGLGIRDPRYRHRPSIRFAELDRAVAVLDVGIAPLSDIAMNRARSNVKLKEYAIAGVPWLASPIGPYVGLGEKQGGRLVADGEWHSALTQLVVDRADRRALAKRARQWGRQQTISANVAQWERLLLDTVARPRSEQVA